MGQRSTRRAKWRDTNSGPAQQLTVLERIDSFVRFDDFVSPLMDPIDYFFMEEFIFPEQGGVTGTRVVTCPHCGAEFELEVDVGNTEDAYQCAECGGEFIVDWVEGTVGPESNDE